MQMAHLVATRATCDRKHVGAVIVKDNRVLSTGYNGSLPGAPHCDTDGHLMVDGHCVRTVHAEANAIAHAAKHGVPLDGSTLYVTASPCPTCYKLAVSAGIQRIVYDEYYKSDIIPSLQGGVPMEKLP